MNDRSEPRERLALQVLALSRVDRCCDCPRLRSLAAVAAERPVVRPGVPAAGCGVRHCKPLVDRIWPRSSRWDAEALAS